MQFSLNFWVWLRSLFFSSTIYLGLFAYVALYQKTVTLATFSESFAFAGGVLMGLSFALSGLSYFFNRWDRQLRYRKQLGLIGYSFALAHAISLLFRFPRYIQQFPRAYQNPESILGLIAMAILTFMAIISANWAMMVMGKHWRTALRLGYLAYGLLIIRAYLILGDTWLSWFNSMNGLPHPRLVLSFYAAAVILLRVGMEISLRTKKKNR